MRKCSDLMLTSPVTPYRLETHTASPLFDTDRPLTPLQIHELGRQIVVEPVIQKKIG